MRTWSKENKWFAWHPVYATEKVNPRTHAWVWGEWVIRKKDAVGQTCYYFIETV